MTAPESGWVARGFSFLTEVGPGGQASSVASELVPVTTVRVVLRNSIGEVVVNRVVTFGTRDEVELSFDIPLSDEDGETLSLTLAYANAAGDTVFRGGPVDVPLLPTRPNQPPPQPPVVPLDYVGVGSEATRVEISVEADTVLSGDAFTFTAVAYDAQSNVVAGAPIAWRSLDLGLATLTSGTAGSGVTLAGRGTARIEAYLLNTDTQSDTSRIEVLPRAASLQLVSGNNQTGDASTQLADSVIVRVRASDNLPIEGVAVTFLAANGGAAGQSTVISDANGLAGTTWTLGAGTGAQSLTASVNGLVGSPVTFNATAEATGPEPPVLLHHFPLDTDLTALTGTSGGTLFEGAAFEFGVLNLDGVDDYVQLNGQLVPTEGSYSISFFMRNRTSETQATYISQGVAAAWRLALGQTVSNRFEFFDAFNVPVTVPANNGLFSHVVLVVDRSVARTYLYVNGTLRRDEAVAGSPVGGSAFRIGRDAETLTRYWNGQMDELRIYSGVLDAATVTTLYDAGMSAPNRFAFTAPPTTTEVGAVIAPAVCVTARDPLGRTLTTFNGSVTIGIGGNPGGATLGGTLTTNAVSGVACFNDLTMSAPGTNYTLVASASGFILSASPFFNVAAPAAEYLVFDQPPTNEAANTAISPPITVWAFAPGDIFDASFTGPVTLEILTGPVGATLGGTLTVNAVAGVATFSDITLDLAGGYTLRATSPGLSDAISPTFTISAAPATQLVFTQQPTAGVANAALAPPVVVEARTAANDLASGFNGNVTIAIGTNPGGATLGGTLTVAAVNGVATFSDLSLSAVGTGYTLAASSPGLTGATSGAFNITAAAVTNSWVNASGGSWSDPANWSENRVPVSSDTVAITLAGTYTVSLDQNISATRLILGGASGVQTLTGLNRGVTTVAGVDVLPNGILQMIGGNVIGGEMRVEGILATFATVMHSAPLYVDTTGLLRAHGSNVYGGGQLTIANGFTNDGTVEFQSLGSPFASTIIVQTGVLVNGPTGSILVTMANGGNATLSSELQNDGQVTVAGQFTLPRLNSTTVNNGAIDVVGSGSVTFNTGAGSSFVNNGDLSLDAGRTFLFSGGTVDLSVGRVLGVDGIVSITGATLSIDVSRFEANLQSGGVGLNFAAPVTVASGDSLRLRSGNFGGASVTVAGTMVLRGGATFSQPLSVLAGGALIVRSSGYLGSVAASATAGLSNAGTIDLVADGAAYTTSLDVSGGPLVNAAGGVIRALSGTGGGSRELFGALQNAGTVTLQTGLTLSRVDADHSNSGTIDVTGGNFSVQQSGTSPSFVNTGTINVASGRLFTVSNGSIDLSGGVVNGRDGFFSTTGSPTLIFTNASLRPRVTLSATTLLPNPFTVPAGDTLRLLNGSFAPPSLNNLGVIAMEGSAAINTPTFTTDAASTLLVRGINVSGAGTASATVQNGFANNGSLVMTAVGTSYNVTLSVPNGTLTNAVGGTISSVTGNGGARTLAAQLDNQGTLIVSQPLNINRVDSDHVNNGLIELLTADLTVTGSGGSPSFVNNDSIHLTAGRTITFAGGSVDLRPGIITGRDAFLVGSGTTTLQFESADVRPRITLGAGVALPDPFMVPAGDTLRLLNGVFAPPSLTNDGVLALEGSAAVTTTTLNTGTGSTILVRGINVAGAGTASVTITNGFTNTATIDLTATGTAYNVTLTVPGGPLVNGPTGVLRSLIGNGGARTLAATLDNQGTVTVHQPMQLARAEAQHQNSGVIELTTADMTVTQTGATPSFTNLNSITLNAGRTFTVNGGSIELLGGVVSGRDAFFVTQGAATLRFENADVRPRITLSAGTVLPDPFTVPAGDTLRVLNGTFAPPALINDGVLALEGAPVITTPTLTTSAGSKILVRGISVAGAGTASATITNGFTNTADIDLTAASTAYNVTLTVPNGTLVNGSSGAITSQVGNGGARTISAQFDNQGTITVLQPLTINRADVDHVNSGVIDVQTGNLSIVQSGATPSFTNLGTVNLASQRVLSISGGLIDLDGGVVNGRDSFFETVGAPTLVFTNASLRPRVTLTAATVIPTPFEVPVGDTLRLLNGSFVPPSLLNNGVLALEGSAVVTTTTLTTGTGSSIVARGINVAGAGTATPTITNGFTNTAIIELTAVGTAYNVTLNVTNGSLVNAVGGEVRSRTGNGGARTLAAQLENQGLFTIEQALTLSRASSAHVNSGTIDLATGNLTVTQTGTTPSFTNLGTVNVPSGRTITFAGGSVDLDGGLIAGRDGFFVTTGSPTLQMTNATVRPRITLSATTVLPDPFEVPSADTLRLLNGTFAVPALTNNGVLALEGSAVLNTPTLTTGSGSTILARGISVAGAGTANVTITNGFINTATIDLTAASTAYNVTLNIPNGELTNSATGVLRSVIGNGGARSLNAQLVNEGTLTVLQDLSLTRADADHRNDGLIDLVSGELTVVSSGASPTFVNNDSIHVPSGRTLTFNGGDVDLRPGIVSGRDGFVVTTGTPTFRFTAADVRPRLTMSAGTILPEPFVMPAGDTLRILNGTFAPPSLTNDGVIAFEGSPTINTPTLVTGTGSTLLVRGINVTGAGTALATFTNGFTNSARIELTAVNTAYNVELRVTNGSLVNAVSGIIRSDLGTGGARTLGAQLDNSGTLELETALNLSRGSSAHINRVPLSLTTANLTVTQSGTTPSFTTLDSINIGSGRSFIVTGGVLDVTNGRITGLGTLSLNGTALAAATSEVFETPLTFGTSSTLAAPLPIPATDTLRFIGGTLAGTNDLIVNGRLEIIGNTTISAPITTNASSQIAVLASTTNGAVTLTTPNGWTNSGTLELTTLTGTNSASFNVTNGVFVNGPGATLRSALGSGGPRNFAAAIDNQGIFAVERNTTINRASSLHANSGTINIGSAATLSVVQGGTTPSFTNTGTVNLAAATSILSVSGGTFTATSGNIQGLGGLTFSGGTQQLDIAVPAIDAVVNFGSGPTLVGALTVPVGDSLRVNGGTIAGAGLQVQGTLVVSGNTSITAPLTTTSGSEIDILASTLTVPQSWTSNGFLRLSAPTAAANPTLTMTGQTLTVASTGFLEMPIGAGTTRFLNAALLDNFGTLDIESPFTLGTGTLTQRLNMTIATGRSLTVGTLNLPPGSTTIVNGTLNVTTCNNTGGSVSGAGVPALCLP